MKFKDFKGAWPPDAGSRWEKEEAVRTELDDGYDENILFLFSIRSPLVGASVTFPVYTVYIAGEEPCSLTMRDFGYISISEVTSVRVVEVSNIRGRENCLRAEVRDEIVITRYFPLNAVKVVREREL